MIVESGSLVLLAATIYLLAKGYLPWEIPAAFFLAFSIPTAIFGGDVLLQVFSGSLLLNLFVLASDPSSRPLNRWGLIFYGTGAGGSGLSCPDLGTVCRRCGLCCAVHELNRTLAGQAVATKILYRFQVGVIPWLRSKE